MVYIGTIVIEWYNFSLVEVHKNLNFILICSAIFCNEDETIVPSSHIISSTRHRRLSTIGVEDFVGDRVGVGDRRSASAIVFTFITRLLFLILLLNKLNFINFGQSILCIILYCHEKFHIINTSSEIRRNDNDNDKTSTSTHINKKKNVKSTKFQLNLQVNIQMIGRSIPLHELSMNLQKFGGGRASDARYSASKSENRNYNFGYNFVHIEARVLILVGSDWAYRDKSKWYIIYPESIVYPQNLSFVPQSVPIIIFRFYPKILSFVPKIYRLSPKFIHYNSVCWRVAQSTIVKWPTTLA